MVIQYECTSFENCFLARGTNLGHNNQAEGWRKDGGSRGANNDGDRIQCRFPNLSPVASGSKTHGNHGDSGQVEPASLCDSMPRHNNSERGGTAMRQNGEWSVTTGSPADYEYEFVA